MEVFRISREIFSSKITASGRSNRWNLDDQFVVYASSSRSLCSLELMVHSGAVVPIHKYKVMVISIADEEELYSVILQKDLPKNWRSTGGYPELQKLGSEWYHSNRSLVLKVPSAVIPKEYNFLINTSHPYFNNHSKISLIRNEDYFWDDRLL
jgi:RES domain-containing protein